MSISQDAHAYITRFPDEKDDLQQLFNHLHEHPTRLFNRCTLPGHITASGIVIQDNHLLCIYHPYIHRWFQPGGHVEHGESPLTGAIREIIEETGQHATLHPWHNEAAVPFDIDIHYIQANPKKSEPGHYHYDFRFLFTIDSTKQPLLNELEYSWVPFEKLDDDLMRVVHKIQTNATID